jgi:hypothetical protein
MAIQFMCIYLLFLAKLLELKMCIEHACETFYTVILDMGKILNLLFDTFHSTKYFYAHLSIIACHFCVGCFTYSSAMKILW